MHAHHIQVCQSKLLVGLLKRLNQHYPDHHLTQSLHFKLKNDFESIEETFAWGKQLLGHFKPEFFVLLIANNELNMLKLGNVFKQFIFREHIVWSQKNFQKELKSIFTNHFTLPCWLFLRFDLKRPPPFCVFRQILSTHLCYHNPLQLSTGKYCKGNVNGQV